MPDDLGTQNLDLVELADRLDQRALLGPLYHVLGYAYEDVASAIAVGGAERPNHVALWRIRRLARAGELMGLSAAAIDLLYSTGSEVAKDAMSVELALRKVDRHDSKRMPRALLSAAEQLRSLADRFTWSWSPRLPRLSEVESYEYLLDRVALYSLEQQLLLYRFRYEAADGSAKEALLSRGLEVTEQSRSALSELLEGAELGTELVAARIVANGFYSAYGLDELNGELEKAPKWTRFATDYGTHRMCLAAFHASAHSMDPRIAQNFAEFLMRRDRPSGKRPVTDSLMHQRPSADPVETAARLLVLSRHLDHMVARKGTPLPAIREWRPAWRPYDAHWLGPAYDLIDEVEKVHGEQRPLLPAKLAALIGGEEE